MGCVDLDGSYSCACPEGYVLADDGVTCKGMIHFITTSKLGQSCALMCTDTCKYLVLIHFDIALDVKECDIGNGGCSQVCVEEEGSFSCKCKPGYVLQIDNQTCSGECQTHYQTS